MEEVRWFITLVTNVGGFGAMSYVLWSMHKDSLRAFREELGAERALFRETLTALQEKRERQHAEALARFEALQSAVRDLKDR